MYDVRSRKLELKQLEWKFFGDGIISGDRQSFSTKAFHTQWFLGMCLITRVVDHVGGFKVCKYIFARCDNEPAPWTSNKHGDCPRPFPMIKELKKATDIINRKDTPSWDYEEKDGCWTWIKPSPHNRKSTDNGNPDDIKSARRKERE
ncbi:hypothetical protein GIB67_006490 [Kingdonia uniflora]|uniref:Uncharacterized protein n=1 Tax=Kingdonia uniflora TaxID=39325 RepID=A0A7J7LEJ1_9MAGN|nr:hypothetical protein GIB67_006490 [Kingdonia uniflora]